MKRLLSVLLAVMMLLSLGSVAFAEEADQGITQEKVLQWLDEGEDAAESVQGQLALQDETREAEAFHHAGFFRSAYRALCRCVERAPQPEAEHRQVLDYECIYTGVFGIMCHLPGRLKFIILDEGVQGEEYPRPVAVCMPAQLLYVLHRVAGRLAGPESRPGNVNGIGTAVYGCDADIQIPRRSKKLKFLHGRGKVPLTCSERQSAALQMRRTSGR